MCNQDTCVFTSVGRPPSWSGTVVTGITEDIIVSDCEQPILQCRLERVCNMSCGGIVGKERGDEGGGEGSV